MKTMRKIFALALAVMMVMSLATAAFAEEVETEEKFTITAPDNTRTYAVYQIFTGDLYNNILSNVVWGKNGTGAEGEAVDQTVLDELKALNTGDKTDVEKLAVIQKYVNLDGEAMGTVSNGSSLEVVAGYYLFVDKGVVADGEAYSLYVVEVVNDVTITPKVGKVTSDKKVDDKNDSNNTEDAVNWQDSADYDIGDDVPFKLSAKLPEDYANYTKYALTFHDDMSEGLTFNNDVKVYIDDTLITDGYEVVTTGLEDGCEFEVRFADLKTTAAEANSVITVEFTAKLNENAKIGSAGNPNTSYVTYSNNPNTGKETETGKTPEDKVIVFTFQIVVNKVDENENPLAGAEFKLEKKLADGTLQTIELKKSEDGTVFTATGLDDGDYILTETKAPNGYNMVDPIEFTITAEHDVLSDNPTLTKLEGGDKFTGEVDAGTVTASVVNKAGTTLPSTGGIGTTIFYAVGGLMVLAAVVLLVTKRRMNMAE